MADVRWPTVVSRLKVVIMSLMKNYGRCCMANVEMGSRASTRSNKWRLNVERIFFFFFFLG